MSRALRTAAAALALMVLAAAALPPDRSAEAQTPTYDVWTTTLTVDTRSPYAGCSDTRSGQDTCSRALSDDSFTYSGATYRFKAFHIVNDTRPHQRALWPNLRWTLRDVDCPSFR